MEISPLLVYLACEAGSFGVFFFVLAVASFLWMLALITVDAFSQLKLPFILFLVHLFIACAIPSTKTIAAMVILPRLTKNENMQALPNDVLEFVRSIIAEQAHEKKDK